MPKPITKRVRKTGFSVFVDTWVRVNKMRRVAETFDQIINRIIDENEAYAAKEQVK
jgi:hypothetical protein